MATERIDIQVREDGSRVVTRNISGIGDAAEKSAGGVDFLKRTLATVVTGATIVSLARLADQYTTIQNQLRVVTTGTENLARVTKELQGIANTTRSDFTATAELYAKLANTTKDLGIGQQQLLDFTKSLNQAIVLSGASAEEAAGGIRQLAQGMASGTLRGDELNSVLENLPVVADVISKSLGITRGELRKMGADGKITAQTILEAFEQAKGSLEQGFATTVPTLSQSLTVLKNNFITFLGEMDQAYGITAKLAQIILTLANNMDTIVPILTAVGAGIAAAFVPSLIASFTTQIKALWAVIAANPWVALATAIASVVVAVTLLRDEIKLGIDETTTLGDLMRAAWETFAPAVETVRQVVGDFFNWLTGTSDDATVTLIKNGEAVGQAQEATWLKVLRTVVQVFDMIGGTIRGTMHGIYNVVTGVISAAVNAFEQLGTAAAAALEGDWDTVMAAAKSSQAGFEAGVDIAGNFAKGFNEEIMAQQDSGLEATLNQWIKRAQEIGADRVKNAKPAGDLNPGGGGRTPTGGGDGKAAEKAARELQRLQNALDGVLSRTNPVRAAQIELAKAQEILTKSVAKGLITQQDANAAYETYKEQLRDQLDPLGAVNRELNEQIRVAQLLGAEREVEIELMRTVQDLKEKGIKLDQQQTAELRAQITVAQELNRIAQAKEDILRNSSAGRAADFATQTTALGQLNAEGQLTQGDKFNAANQQLGGLLTGSQADIDAQLEQQQELYTRLQELREADLVNEDTYQQARLQLWANTQALQLQQADTFFGMLAQLSKSENTRLAGIGKAAAIAQTTIKTYESATSAYAAMAGIPYVGPFLGAAAAAAAVAAGLANVQAIKSQSTAGFKTGGSYTVGGYGGQDSQMVAFRATPGEKININTPAQARALERLGERQETERPQRNIQMNLTVVQQGRPDRTTPEQTARNLRKEGMKFLEVN